MYNLLEYTDSLVGKLAKESSTRKFVENFNKCVKGEYQILDGETYNKTHGKIKLQHFNCGGIIEVSPANLLDIKNSRVKTGCRKCAMETVASSQRFTLEKFKSRLKEVGYPIEEYTFLSDYVNTETKIAVKHKCGETIQIRPREMMQGNQCCKCANVGKSRMEQELKDFLSEILPEEESNENARILDNKRKEVDIFFPERKIAVEFNGSWWHKGETKATSDNDKLFELSEKDIQLITVREHEWRFSKDIVKNRLRVIFGKTSMFRREYARKLTISEVDSTTRCEFLRENHIQGADKAFLSLGLFNNNELLAVMTFSKPRISLGNKDNGVELSRFCVKQGVMVVGGFSKLLKASKGILSKEYSSIKTYAALSYSLGNVYETNGFTLDGYSKPSYWYVKHSTGVAYHRFNFFRSKIKSLAEKGKLKFYDDSLSEEECMLKNGYYRVYDSGNLVYSLEI